MSIQSLPSFKRAAERSFRRANPGVEITIRWMRAAKVRWIDGSIGYSGSFAVEANGYVRRLMLASYCGGQLMVR